MTVGPPEHQTGETYMHPPSYPGSVVVRTHVMRGVGKWPNIRLRIVASSIALAAAILSPEVAHISMHALATKLPSATKVSASSHFPAKNK